MLLNLTAAFVGWYRISLQGLLRLYEKPLSKINAKNTTCGTRITGGASRPAGRVGFMGLDQKHFFATYVKG